MATTVKPLDGGEGYLRWKESVLLRLHTLGVSHVLSEDRPAGDEAAPAAAKKWARDDAVCRGHILATLSDRLFPDYVRHATAREVWQAVARTYELDTSRMGRVSWREFDGFQFDEGAPLLEQLAHLEALAADVKPPISDDTLAHWICKKLPEDVAIPAMMRSSNDDLSMSTVWHVARIVEATRISYAHEDELKGNAAMAEDQEDKRKCWNCGQPGHIARNCVA